MSQQTSKALSFLFIGGFGNVMFDYFQDQINQFQLAGNVRCIGIVDLGRNFNIGRHGYDFNFSHMGLPDISPKQYEIVQSLALGKGKRRRIIFYKTLLERVTIRLIKAYRNARTEPSLLVFLVSKYCLEFIRPMVEELKSRLPMSVILLVTCAASTDIQNERILQEVRAAQTLQENGLVEKVIVVDEAAVFTKEYREVRLKQVTYHLVLSPLRAKPFNDLLKDMPIPFVLYEWPASVEPFD